MFALVSILSREGNSWGQVKQLDVRGGWEQKYFSGELRDGKQESESPSSEKKSSASESAFITEQKSWSEFSTFNQ